MTRTGLLIVTIVLGLLGLPGQDAAAQSETPKKPVNLVGDWSLNGLEVEMAGGHRWDNETFEGGMSITRQNGAVLGGKSFFKLKSGRAHDGETHVTERDIEMLGVISWSGDEVTLVSHGEKDGWVFNGKIAGPDEIEFVAYETGEHGWAARYLARRQ